MLYEHYRPQGSQLGHVGQPPTFERIIMELCSDGHEEICHDQRLCPVCEVILEMQKQIDQLESNIEELQQQIE